MPFRKIITTNKLEIPVTLQTLNKVLDIDTEPYNSNVSYVLKANKNLDRPFLNIDTSKILLDDIIFTNNTSIKRVSNNQLSISAEILAISGENIIIGSSKDTCCGTNKYYSNIELIGDLLLDASYSTLKSNIIDICSNILNISGDIINIGSSSNKGGKITCDASRIIIDPIPTETNDGTLAVVGNLDISGNLNIGSTVGTGGRISADTNRLIIDPYTVGDTTGVVQILGGLIVDGSSTIIYSNVVDISDKTLTLASGSITSGQLDGAGIEISNNNISLLYNLNKNKWVSSIGFESTLELSSNNLYVSNDASFSSGVTIAGDLSTNNLYVSQDVSINGIIYLPTINIKSDINSGLKIGNGAGQTDQSNCSIAIGYNAGFNSQDTSAIAIGVNAGKNNQAENAIAIGSSSGFILQGESCIALGNSAGQINQNEDSIAIGNGAGQTDQSNCSIAIGYNAGFNSQDMSAIAIGTNAGKTNQSERGIAIGTNSGTNTQGIGAIAIGSQAAQHDQLNNSIAIGTGAGQSQQGQNCIAIGTQAASTRQGNSSIAIGGLAGQTDMSQNCIVINATGSALNTVTGNGGCFIRPIRSISSAGATSLSLRDLKYNASTGEIFFVTP